MRSRQPASQRYRDAFAHRDLVHELEALIDRAWPALTVLDVDGWQLRSARGFTRLVNSVWPRDSRDGLAVGERINRVERLYAERGQQPCFWLSPSASPRGLDRVLADRGYEATPSVEVRTARLDQLAELGTAGQPVTLLSAPEWRWLQAWAQLATATDEETDIAAKLLARARAEQVFAVLDGDEDGEGAAVARGVLHGGWLGLDCLAVADGVRAETAGHALIGTLARWAVSRGGQQAYCQLDKAESSARALTRGMRLEPAYSYRFRVHPLPPRPGTDTSRVSGAPWG